MKKTILSKILATGIILVAFLSSCGVWNLDSKMKNLELGMTKQEVVNRIGAGYTSLGAISTPDGNLETVRYQGSEFDRDYVVRFLDGRLVEWFVDRPSAPATVPVQVNVGN